jgi:hypothetical protein
LKIENEKNILQKNTKPKIAKKFNRKYTSQKEEFEGEDYLGYLKCLDPRMTD